MIIKHHLITFDFTSHSVRLNARIVRNLCERSLYEIHYIVMQTYRGSMNI